MPAHELLQSVSLPSDVLELIEQAPLPGLDDQPKCPETTTRIREVMMAHPQLQRSPIEAALWLLAGDLERSHEVSQAIENSTGSYWHGIMHRREGDFWNSKYWFQRVGEHSILIELAQQCEQSIHSNPTLFAELPKSDLSNPRKVAYTLVDGCQQALGRTLDVQSAWQQICWWEWQLLFRNGWKAS